jgi:hypothetical protein
MCVYDVDRFAICFEFQRHMSHDCQEFNDCQNDDRCFQNNRSIIKISVSIVY